MISLKYCPGPSFSENLPESSNANFNLKVSIGLISAKQRLPNAHFQFAVIISKTGLTICQVYSKLKLKLNKFGELN
jgi:hypothetical protein